MKKKISILPILVIIFAILGFFWWQQGTAPVNKNDKSEKLFVINPGSGLKVIADDLKNEGLIRDTTVFTLLVRQKGLDKKILAGDFRLSPNMTPLQIATALTESPLDIWITIPEGKRAEEIAEILEERVPTYEPSWEDQLVEHEGYLFPDTYLIPKDVDIETVISLLTNIFEERYATIDTSNTDLTKEEIVILASMIEREAKHDEDRPIISSVMHNRLDIGMALQIDATIQYAKGRPGAWWAPVTLAEYKSVKSPYNTYLQPGLPPGPIANPGIKALDAAANPANTDYLYYITDQNGVNRYAETNEQHNANIERYGL